MGCCGVLLRIIPFLMIVFALCGCARSSAHLDIAKTEEAVSQGSLIASAGDDMITGGLGNDVLRGSSGNDRLVGNAGDDRLEGGDPLREHRARPQLPFELVPLESPVVARHHTDVE